MRIEWAQFESFTTARGLDILMIEDSNNYYLTASEFGFIVTCNIDKNASDNTVLTHFEANHKTLCNIFKPYQMAKKIICTSGKTLQCFSFSYKTSQLDSIFCKQTDNVTDQPGITFKIFNAAGTQLMTQEDADLYAVLTQVEFNPTFSYEIIEGHIYILTPPTTPVHVYCIGAPDIPAQYGGSKELCTGGFDLRYLQYAPYEMDGRATKELAYIEGVGANKLLFKSYHNAGVKCELQVRFGFYK